MTVYLVDKPAAAQSVLAVGQVGLPRSTPDYFPLTVMNAILGGQFSSRINLNLREDKGYTYGAHSHFAFRLGPGPFEAGGCGPDRGDQGGAGRADQGADRHHRPAPGRPTRSWPSPRTGSSRASPNKFETTFGVAGDAGRAWSSTTSRPTTSRPTRRRSRPSPGPTSTASPRSTSTRSRMAILVVGDRSKIEAALKASPTPR